MAIGGRTRIGDFYEAIVDDEAYAAMPALLAQALGARAGVVQQFDRNGLVDFRSSYYTGGLLADFARIHPDGRDIWTDTGLRFGLFDRAAILDDWLPLSAFQRSPLWNAVLRPHGDDTGHSLGLIHRFDDTTLCVSVHRAIGAGAFGRTQADRLDALATDLHRMHRARRLLREKDARIARLDHLLEGARAKVLLVGRDLALLEASPSARALLDRRDGLALQAGRLRLHDVAGAGAVREAANRTIDRLPVGRATFLCPRPGGGAPWRLLVLPLGAAHPPGCMILIAGGDVPGDRVRLWLVQHYGATASEAAVAQALLDGDTPEEIAETRDVSINTVRTQIRRLLEKTATRGVSQLLLLLARLG